MPKTTPLQKDYRLADHVRACHVDGQVILLDLLRNKYIGVGGSLLAALSCRVADWPAIGGPNRDAAADLEVDRWISSMHEQGMLATTATATQDRLELAEPDQSIFACEPPARTGVQWRRTANIFRAAVIVGHWLRRHPLLTIARHIRGLRPAIKLDLPDACQGNLQDAVSWYLSTRPFLMTSHDECLRDSLTLLRFLATEHLYPRWVIGVRTRPFSAHSWVQQGGLVLNDVHENVRRYTPILIL